MKLDMKRFQMKYLIREKLKVFFEKEHLSVDEELEQSVIKYLFKI